jgi:hypothetical protein
LRRQPGRRAEPRPPAAKKAQEEEEGFSSGIY